MRTLAGADAHGCGRGPLLFATLPSLGDSKNGITLLEKAAKERSDYLIFLNVDPMGDSLRAIPSFQALLGQIGLTK